MFTYFKFHRQPSGGFTLMEMMITVAILALVAAFAIPSYLGQITKSRRTDAKVTLAETAQKLERCFSEANTYQYASDSLAQLCPQSSDLNNLSDYYNFTVSVTNSGTNYTLKATAKGQQLARDVKCKTLTLNKLNEKKSTNSSNTESTKCW